MPWYRIDGKLDRHYCPQCYSAAIAAQRKLPLLQEVPR